MSSNFGVYNIEADLEATVTSSFQNSADPESETVNWGLRSQTAARDRAEYEFTNNPHINALLDMGSETHEVSNLNAYFSGTQGLENSENAASGSVYLSKQSRFQKITYKVSADVDLPEVPSNLTLPNTSEFGSRSVFVAASGSYRNASYWNPAEIELDVAEYGKIRDVKVWVEFVHDYRSGHADWTDVRSFVFSGPATNNLINFSVGDILRNAADTVRASIVSIDYTLGHVHAEVTTGAASFSAGATITNVTTTDTEIFSSVTEIPAAKQAKHGLQGVQLALRSPNTSFKHAHPLWNEKTLENNDKDSAASLGSYKAVPDLLKNSYLLWAGHAVENDLAATLGNKAFNIRNGMYATSTVASSYTGLNVNDVLNRNLIDIKVDSFNRPNIVYNTLSGGIFTVKYARLSSAGWVSYTVSSSLFTYGVGGADENIPSYLNLHLDSDNNPSISFKIVEQVSALATPSDKVIFCISKDRGTTWTTERVTNEDSSTADNVCKLAYDSSGSAHIINVNNNSISLFKRASNETTSSWAFRKLEDVSFDAQGERRGPAICFDKDDKLNVIYGVPTDNTLKRLVVSASRSFTEVIPALVSAVPLYPSVLFDRNGTLHVVCSHFAASSLSSLAHYASSSDGWRSSFVDTKVNEFNYKPSSPADQKTFLCLNKTSGLPLIVWSPQFDSANSFQIRASQITNFGYSTSIVHTSSSLTTSVSPTFAADTDSLGNQHIVYMSAAGAGATALSHSFTTGSVVSVSSAYVMATGTLSSSFYHSFDRDLDMRTIFTDSSLVANPRHKMIESRFDNTAQKLTVTNQYFSPSSASLNNYFRHLSYKYDTVQLERDTFLTGANVPWMLSTASSPGYLTGKYYAQATSSDGTIFSTNTSAPVGWVTGDFNEWTTWGFQLGPEDIKPVYPLLDDIFVEKINDQQELTSVRSMTSIRRKLVGFRPGLRGTEIHGKWKLLIGNNADIVSGVLVPRKRDGIWFRQFRVEFLVDTGKEVTSQYPSKNKRFDRHGIVSGKAGKLLNEVVSGSAAWDIGVNHVYTVQPEDYGRSIGITSDISDTNFAVQATLSDEFTSSLNFSGTLESVKESFLNNEFGTPYIPISVGSVNKPTSTPFTELDIQNAREIFGQTLNPSTLIPLDRTLNSYISKSKIVTSTRDLIMKKLLGL